MIAGERTSRFSRALSGAPAPPALKSAIVEETRAACVNTQGAELLALVLTGSLARDEAGFVQRGDRWQLAGDVDLMAVKERGPLPAAGAVESLCRSIEGALGRRNLDCRISIAFGYPSSLRSMPPHIFGYELRACGEVIWGDGNILSLVPDFSAAEIPLEDAWRLLNNRIVEYLEALAGGERENEHVGEKANQAAVKLYLDMATSLLLFAGCYEPSYRARLENLNELAASAAAAERDWPFNLAEFTERVAACTAWKLAPENTGTLPQDLHAGAISHARALWKWETARLTGLGPDASLRELSAAQLSLQPLAQRLRGWAYAARQFGWLPSARQLPRWGRLMWQASPRHCIYLAAAELLLQALPAAFPDSREAPRQAAGSENRDPAAWRARLPVARKPAGAPGAWQRLAADIAWNYHTFVEGTRA